MASVDGFDAYTLIERAMTLAALPGVPPEATALVTTQAATALVLTDLAVIINQRWDEIAQLIAESTTVLEKAIDRLDR